MHTSPGWARECPITRPDRLRLIVLVGLPGSGKSTLGRALAERLRLRFVDLDEEIARREGLSVPEIFARRGEAYFRHRELEETQRLARDPIPAVVATGGGWVTNREAMALLRPLARIIYLRASPHGSLRRIGAGVAGRPLLAGPDPEAALTRLLLVRQNAYAQADAILDVENVAIQELTDTLQSLAAPAGEA